MAGLSLAPDFQGEPFFSGVVPIGTGTAALESLSSYVIRVGNRFALPAPDLLRYALTQVPGVRRRRRLLAWGALNGAGPSVAVAVEGLATVTGLTHGERMSYTGLVHLLRLHDRELVSPIRRWCLRCWADDDPPYDRKLWWLGLVDACPVHACLLETRCGTCGRLQPSLTLGVRLHHCSYCGHDLMSAAEPLPLGAGAGARRRLWYARQAADLVHADEVIALIGSDESDSVRTAYAALAEHATARGLDGVSLSLRRMRVRKQPTVGWLEALLSALWRLDQEVLVLFSPAVGEAVRASSDRASSG